MDQPPPAAVKGRGVHSNPPNRFRRIAHEPDAEHADPAADEAALPQTVPTEYYVDDAQSIVSENDSPDIPFRYSLNPYRGCAHGCSYCYARPTHEYLDLSAGLDFETKIMVKERAPELFRAWLARSRYQPETVMMSGVTDCYQPIERQLRLTRRCLEVAWEARQPMALVTKNALIARDVDLLSAMASLRLAAAAVSITTLDQALVKVMEPRTASPEAKLRTIAALAQAGVPTRVLIAPVIPGLTDHEIPAILKAAKEAGATSASYILLRLPLTVEPIFREWLERTHPEQQAKVESRIRATRGGELYESGYNVRMRGRGEIAEHIRNTFEVFARQLGLNGGHEPLDTTLFRRPTKSVGQQWLF